MKGKIIRSRGNAPPVVTLVALLLALGVAATTPLAFAKYYGNGSVTASARVAKWAPKVEVADGWGKIAFVASDGGWLAATDVPYATYTAAGHPRTTEWAMRPSNLDNEVAAKYKYSLTAPGDNVWVHFDPGHRGAVNVSGSVPGFREDIFGAGADTPTTMTPADPKQAIFVYFSYTNGRPYAPTNCYSTATFSWTIEQID